MVELIPILDDNYVFAIHDAKSSKVILVDPGHFDSCYEYLQDHKLELSALLITHHHPDHIDGIPGLLQKFPSIKIFAPFKNKAEIPWATHYVRHDDIVKIDSYEFQVLELPGHTLGICGYFEYSENWLFSGDVLFGLGCGRLFEGNPEMLFESLKKIKKLPTETKIFCSHEYTTANMIFSDSLIQNKKIPARFDFNYFEKYKSTVQRNRAQKKPTVPLILNQEMLCNPFLLAESVSELGELRQQRNVFRIQPTNSPAQE